MVNDNIIARIGEWVTKVSGGYSATDMVEKMTSYIGMQYSDNSFGEEAPKPPYQRTFSPIWIYKLRRDQGLLNNAIDKKVKQVFRDGFSDWKQEYDAKCPRCREEFQGYDAFRNQMGEQGDELVEDDFDFESERVCPECEEVVEMMEPNDDVWRSAQTFFDRANAQGGEYAGLLEPAEQSSVSQSVMDVFQELAWDLESFDDAWMLLERDYQITEDGHVVDYDLQEIQRAPPELMQYSFDEETQQPGGEFWICLNCRSEKGDNYQPEVEEQRCSDCGRVTYECYAYVLTTPNGEPRNYFIRGEFAHDSMYETKRFYGYPPILSLWEEARTLEQMDSWYYDAYMERRAPRGAITVNAARDEELRNLNYQQMEKLREDPNYIPLFMNDQETEGDPIKFVELLSDPAEMQHMEMREWFKERVSAKWGVTSILMTGSPENSGLSQSMEVEVSQKAAEDLRAVFERTFLPTILAQLGTEGWTRDIEPAVDEDESEEAQLVGQHLNNAQKALQMGAEVEWTEDDRAIVKQGELEAPEEGQEGMMGGMGGMPGMGAGGEEPQGVGDMMGMEGGVGDDRGPEPHSVEPGEDHMVDEEGERAEGPDDPDRPSASPLERMLDGEDGDVEKIAAGALATKESDSEKVARRI